MILRNAYTLRDVVGANAAEIRKGSDVTGKIDHMTRLSCQPLTPKFTITMKMSETPTFLSSPVSSLSYSSLDTPPPHVPCGPCDLPR